MANKSVNNQRRWWWVCTEARLRRFLHIPIVSCILVGLFSFSSRPAFGQNAVPPSEVEALKEEIRKLQERLNKLEQTQKPTATPAAQALASVAPRPGEREVSLEKGHILGTAGLPGLEFGNTRLSGFFVGSASYNSHIQMVPEFAGGAQALADPGHTNFRFDKFGLAVFQRFASWLSASAAIEVESHRDRHTHGFDPAFGCPGTDPCFERFGSEQAETEINLDRLNITGIAPIGNGLVLSFGRFDVPFGIERHDEPLNLTATTSEVFQFGRPQRMTGFQISYQFAPELDVTAWLVNRWESDTTHDPFDDNNRDKSWGGRIGFTPFAKEHWLNFGVGGFYGPEQDGVDSNKRWVLDLDFTWSPISELFFAGEAIYGSEDNVELRERGVPIAAPAGVEDPNWWGFYLLTHYDLYDWLGLSFRYGLLDDLDGARTGVEQLLQSWTFALTFHLSQLVPDLLPIGATYARTRHPINWLDLKIEYRLNHSNEAVFSDAREGVNIDEVDNISHPLQLQLITNF